MVIVQSGQLGGSKNGQEHLLVIAGRATKRISVAFHSTSRWKKAFGLGRAVGPVGVRKCAMGLYPGVFAELWYSPISLQFEPVERSHYGLC